MTTTILSVGATGMYSAIYLSLSLLCRVSRQHHSTHSTVCSRPQQTRLPCSEKFARDTSFTLPTRLLYISPSRYHEHRRQPPNPKGPELDNRITGIPNPDKEWAALVSVGVKVRIIDLDNSTTLKQAGEDLDGQPIGLGP